MVTGDKPPFIPVPNCLQAEMVYGDGFGYAENVIHVQGDAVIQNLDATADRLATTIHNWWTNNRKSFLPPSMSYFKTVVRDMGTQGGFVKEYIIGEQGTRAGAVPCPNNVSIAAKMSTGYGGRSNRGRLYHIGLSTNVVTGDQVVGSELTALTTLYNALKDGIKGSGWNTAGDQASHLCVVSKRHNKEWRLTGTTKEVVAFLFADSYIDSQRRRLAGRGS